MTPSSLFSFHRNMRLTKKKQYLEMYAHGTKSTVGPLLIHRKSNSIGHARLGLSVPRTVGNAVIRNTIKRRCREAFRTSIEKLPANIDILVTVRPHSPLQTHEYASLLRKGTS